MKTYGPWMLVAALAFTTLAAAGSEFAIFKSGDRGRTWVRSDAGMPHESRINAFGTLDGILFAGTDTGIFVSGDEARSWQPAAGAAMSSGRVISFATADKKAFAGTDGSGMLTSSDGGKTWSQNVGFPAKKVRCLLAHAGFLYAGTDTEGVLVSSDGGQRWAQLQGLPAHAQVFALTAVEGRLFAGLYSKGLYAWDAKEKHWSKAGPVTPLALAAVDGTLIAGHNPGGLHWSSDFGSTWSKGTAITPVGNPSPPAGNSGELSSDAPVWELASNDDLVFAGASADVYYSEDRGRTWTMARTGLPDESPGVSFLLTRTFVLAGTQLKDTKDAPGEALKEKSQIPPTK